MPTPPFVTPLRLGTAEAGEAGVLVAGSLALLFDPAQVTLTYDPNVVSTGDGASVTGAVRVELVDSGAAPYTGTATTSGAETPSPVSIVVPVNSAMAILALVVGYEASSGKFFQSYTLLPAGRQSGDVNTGTPQALGAGVNNFGGSVDAGFTTTNPDTVNVTLSGDTGFTIVWKVSVQVLSVP
jgi:hypothetical protein